MSEIQVLSQIEAVRKNPWMYVGSVGEDGAYHLVNEVIQNSIDEFSMGYGNEIRIRLLEGGVEISDNGRGIPVDLHPTERVSSCEVALTRLHAGSKFQRKSSLFTTGIHGVGLSCVNALSSGLQVSIRKGGKKYIQAYKKGEPLGPLTEIGASEDTGTSIRFYPDQQIFRDFRGYETKRIADLLETLSFLNAEVSFVLHGLGDSVGREFRSGDGLQGLWKKSAAESILEIPLQFRWKSPELEFEGYASWGIHQKEHVLSFVNGVATPLAGSHVDGFRAGLFLGLTSWLKLSKSMGDKADSIQISDISDGWIAAVHCKLVHPNFEGQTKSRLTNSEIFSVLEQEIADQMMSQLAGNPKIAGIILQRIIESRVSRIAAKRAAERVYLQNVKKEIDVEVYKEQFGERSKTWHQSAVWITHEELLKSHGDFCKVSPDAVALDVCCGSGVVGASFRGHVKKVIGLDLTPQMVNLARTRLDEVVQGNVYEIPFPDGSFDLVCTREVLHLLPYPERPVSEIFRVLKPGGQFVVGQILPFGAADAAWMYRIFKKKQPLIYNMFQESDFRSLLLNAGFVDLEMKEMNVWESIDVWINSYETTEIHRHEIRELFKNAPSEVRDIHPFKIAPSGEIMDLWRWCIFSVRKPG